MDWTQPIDAYCERLGPGLWAEPFNAVSNAAFIIAALVGAAVWRRGTQEAGRADRAGLAMVVLVAVIGIGSLLFHTFANRWSVLADVIPIAFFIYAYFALALARLVGLRWWVALLATLVFLGASTLADPLIAEMVGSSSGYVPALLAMVGIGVALVVKGRSGSRTILLAAAVFTASLGLRIADMPICAAFPLGTHFLWHILNAATLGLLLVALLKGRAAPADPLANDPSRSRRPPEP